MRRAGARTLAQDEASCLIYGMPKAAFECGGAEMQVPLSSEIDPDRVDRQRGMDITIVTTATNDDEGRALLRRLGFPFRDASAAAAEAPRTAGGRRNR